MGIVSTLTDTQNLITAFAGVLSFATVVTLAGPLMNRDNLDSRMKSVANRREELRRRSREALAKETSIRQRDESLYKKIVDKLNLQTLLEDPKVVEKLAQAGYRGPKPLSTYYFFRFVLPFVFAALLGVYLFALNDHNLSFPMRLLATVAGFVVGFYAPNLWIKNVASKRRVSIVRAFP